MTDPQIAKAAWLTYVFPSRLAALLTLFAGLCMLAVMVIQQWLSSGTDFLLLDFIDGTDITWLLGLATVALLATALGFITRRWPHRGSFVLALFTAFALLGVLCFIFLILFANSGRNYTPIETGSSVRDVVVRETSFLFLMSGEVYERNGLFLTPRQSFVADDGYQPFRDGEYDAEWVGDQLRLRYKFFSDDTALSTEMTVKFD